jgi:allophanate hydrolase subunit 1
LVFDDRISLAAHRDVLRLTPLLQSVRGVTNVHPAYASILIDFDPRAIRHGDWSAPRRSFSHRRLARRCPSRARWRFPWLTAANTGRIWKRSRR